MLWFLIFFEEVPHLSHGNSDVDKKIFFVRNRNLELIKNDHYMLVFSGKCFCGWFHDFLWIIMHASWMHSISFFLQKSIALSLCAHGCIQTFLIHNAFTCSKTFSVTTGGVTKITMSIFFSVAERVEWTFVPRISFSVGLMGITLYHHANRSLKTLYPYFSSLLDAPTTA